MSPHGDSDTNLRETHCHMQRRLDDYPLAHPTTPTEVEQMPPRCMTTYKTTAHSGVGQDGFTPLIPRQGLGDAFSSTLPNQ